MRRRCTRSRNAPGVVGVEGDDELLVVEAEAVRRVVVDARVLLADADVLLHHAPALVGGQARTTRGASRTGRRTGTCRGTAAATEALLVGVLGGLAHARGTSTGCEHHFISPLWASTTWNSWMRSRFSASIDEHQVGVAADADEREGLQQVIGGEVLAGGEELALVARALLVAGSRRQAGSTFRKVYLTKCRSAMVRARGDAAVRLRGRTACGQNSGDARPAPIRGARARARRVHRRGAAARLPGPARRGAGPLREPRRSARGHRVPADPRPRAARRRRRRRAAARLRPILERLAAREQLSIGLISATQGQLRPDRRRCSTSRRARASRWPPTPQAPARARGSTRTAGRRR